MADMNGKVCIVTGANSGIGQATTLGLVNKGAHVIMACRNLDLSKPIQEEIRDQGGSGTVELMECDLGSHSSIHTFVDRFKEKHTHLDVLVNNAALMPLKRTETADGIETQFGVNHLGPFTLTQLLLDTLKAAAPSRIVNVASTVHHGATINFDDLESREKYGVMKAYGQSKLANVLFTYELARRLEGTGVSANCLHPGVVRTNITRDLPGFIKPFANIFLRFVLSPERGAETSIYLASSPEVEGVTGRYFEKCAEAPSNEESRDEQIAKRLWKISVGMTGVGD